MRFSTFCGVGLLAMAMSAWGCGDDTVDDGLDGPDGPDGAGGAETGPGAPEPVPTAGPEQPQGEGAAGGKSICAARSTSSQATHVVVQVSWPASLAITAGKGEMHVWTKAELTVQGSAVTGTARPCGATIPALTAASGLGGGKLQVEIPPGVWSAPTMPVFQIRGTTTGFDMGDAVSMEPLASLVGATMDDPLTGAWPAKVSRLTLMDPDGDGHPGIPAIPRTDPPFGAPPVDIASALNPPGRVADRLDLATRTVMSFTGTRDSCSSVRGTASVTRVDSHVVGCHVQGDGECTKEQSGFIDAVQPRFTVESATFEMREVPASATCADVRAALPAR